MSRLMDGKANANGCRAVLFLVGLVASCQTAPDCKTEPGSPGCPTPGCEAGRERSRQTGQCECPKGYVEAQGQCHMLQPDLIIDSLDVQPDVSPDGTGLTLCFSEPRNALAVKNQGNGDAGPYTAAFGLWDVTAKRALGCRVEFKAGTTAGQTSRFNMGCCNIAVRDLHAGNDYAIFAAVDIGMVIAESNEDNNVSLGPSTTWNALRAGRFALREPLSLQPELSPFSFSMTSPMDTEQPHGASPAPLEQSSVPSEKAASTQGISGQISLRNGLTGLAIERSENKSALCVRAPWGPGIVNWSFSDPADWGYSVKPESSWELIWARPPTQAIDGIYNEAWGCNLALKVPDSCTVTMTDPDTLSYCCNAAMWTLGYRIEWVNSSAIGWPSCPLY